MMKICTYIFIVTLLFSKSELTAQNFLFKEPRQGGFKIKKNERFDFTNAQHFTGSGILAVGTHKIFRDAGIKHNKICAALFATTIGLLKELEDGYRDGWGMKDVVFNELGIFTFLLLSDYTHYTLTFKQVISGPNDYGAGIRFFRTSEFTPLNASLGIYVVYDNKKDTWVGVDSHFRLLGRAELHLSVSAINLNNANLLYLRPNLGFGFRLF